MISRVLDAAPKDVEKGLPHLAGSALWAALYGCPSPKATFQAVSALTNLAKCDQYQGPALTPRAELDPMVPRRLLPLALIVSPHATIRGALRAPVRR